MTNLSPCPFVEMDRSIMALALELPGPVWDDVKKIWDKVRETRAPQWQPIKTAPRDGTEVLLCRVEKWTEQLWGKNGESIKKPRVDYEYNTARFHDGEWLVAEQGDGYEYQVITMRPSHWKPLDKPLEEKNDTTT